MQLSYKGLQFLKEREGFRDKAYKDTGGVWTIGYGTTVVEGRPVEQGQTCTEQQAQLWCEADTRSAQTAVNQLVRVPLTQNQFDALVSFTYNLGTDALRKSTLLRKLNLGQMDQVGTEFDRWVFDNGKKIDGLVTRRKLERELFES